MGPIDNNRRQVRMKIEGVYEIVRWYDCSRVEQEPALQQIRKMGVGGGGQQSAPHG